MQHVSKGRDLLPIVPLSLVPGVYWLCVAAQRASSAMK